MRINRPDGIAQENRSHPFFILLRKFADEQQREAIDLTKSFIITSVMLGVMALAACITLVDGISSIIFILPCMTITIYLIYRRYRTIQLLLHDNAFDEVDHMIHSNDYQLSNINMEKMINMMNQCTEVTGRIKALRGYLYESSAILVAIELVFIIYRFVER